MNSPLKTIDELSHENRPLAEIKYRYFKWKMNRVRRKFDVYTGGRNDWDRHVH